MARTRFYITTPIYYVNDKPHVGHAYTTVAADVLARWNRMNGRPVTFLTGTDEHGQKVMEAASKRGISPMEHVDSLAPAFQALWQRLNITHDDFIRTTEPRHTVVVQRILSRLKDQGDIYEDAYEGWYSTAAERFWTEKDLVDGKCPDTGQPVEWVRERNYFFRMSKYADQLRAWIEAHPGFIRPENRRNEVLGYLRKEVGDLCISRTKARMSWGIELPFDPDFVTYVWFDALSNYISAVGYTADEARFQDHWPANVHLMGKDILTTHSVYWSTMLFALGLTPADIVFAHGWWTVEGQKMSKSLGNVVDPHLLLDCYGADPVRYFLMREIPFGLDGDFSHTAFLLRYNADLANDLGNLAHRALSMTEKWLGGVVPELDEGGEPERALDALAASATARFREELENLQFSKALESLWELVRAGNKYIDTLEPWKLNREGQTTRLAGVMRRSLELCRVTAIHLAAVCPDKMAELGRKLGLSALDLDAPDRLDGLRPGAAVSTGDPLFPRLLELPEAVRAALASAGVGGEPAAAKAEKPKKHTPKNEKKAGPANAAPPASPGAPMSESTPVAPAPAASQPAAPAENPLITIDDFAKVQLRTGLVVAGERHPSADRLLVLKVDVGEAEPRTIVAGIASRYAPEELVGTRVIVVINLKPVKLRGVLSQGMLLAAGGGDVKAMATTTEEVPPGTIVR